MAEFVKKVVVDVKASSVHRMSTIKRTKHSAERQMDITYNFESVSEETLLELASRTIHIAYQGAWRSRADGDDPLPLYGNVDVAEYLAAERRGGGFKASPKSLTKLASKLSQEDIAETIRRLQEMQASTDADADTDDDDDNDNEA